MKLLILGGAGGTGRLLTAQAREQGHEVTVLVRNRAALTNAHEGLRMVIGDAARDAAVIADAVLQQDVVISALGRRNSFGSANLMLDSMRLLVPAMKNAAVRRLIIVSALGVGESRRDAPLLPRIMYRLLLHNIFADKLAAENYVRHSELDWTFVYPVLLTNGPRTGHYRSGERLQLRGMPAISRADVADFILRQLVESCYVRKTVEISY